MIAEVIAGAINYERDFNKNEQAVDALHKLSVTLAMVLREDNPRFDTNRFFDDCGVK